MNERNYNEPAGSWPCFVVSVLQGVFIFQAEDGIRGIGVTVVQTCALPIGLYRTTLDLALLCCRLGGLRRFSPSQDRKSTRLNSSHANISYAVFCLKKKSSPALGLR